ncbi:hypothetical protein [Luteococcus peritonei]|uniref:Uncharacterized protein n=1 Tax=Luteococcus peritonei TaxID=88874 RepID=A0ABW4RW44_9ACTN
MNSIISLALLVLWVAAVAVSLRPRRDEPCAMPGMVMESVGLDQRPVLDQRGGQR